MGVSLYDYQEDAVNRMRDGCILCGGVGSGKSRTALAYFYTQYGGQINTKNYVKMTSSPDLYVITTARKRDKLEWEGEFAPFRFSLYPMKVVVDSWNNIQKYGDITDAFFIFDEQRVVGSGTWAKTFLKIAKRNRWILLSATPGDTWSDYIPVFLANGYYKNRTEFVHEHIVYCAGMTFPKIDRYVNTNKLVRLRNSVLVNMDFERQTISTHDDVFVDYDMVIYKDITKRRWDIWKNEPMTSASDLCYGLRKLVNSDESRQIALLELLEKHPKVIVFYNFDYELDILRSLGYPPGTEIAEWNGHRHQEIPSGDKFVYLVQYVAGCEGWNCITTDTVVFYSQSYSFKVMTQAAGRIDRLNTPYKYLYYYHFKSRSSIDLAISRALASKKNFNEGGFANKYYKPRTGALYT